MTKDRFNFALAVIALIAAIGCGLFKGKPAPLASELADKSAPPFTPLEVKLNAEPSGTTGDLTELRNKIREIMLARESNGVFREGSAEIENSVYLLVGPQLPAVSLAAIALAINDNRGKAHIPLPAAMAKADESTVVKPNPLTLVATAGANINHADIMLWRVDPNNEKFFAVPTFEITDDKIDILLARVNDGSIEISADGNYFINDLANLENTSGPEDVKIVQRAATPAEVKTEALKLIESPASRGELTVVVSENAPTDSVLKLFPLLEGKHVRWRVVVRRPVKEKH